MDNDSPDTIVKLGNAVLMLHLGGGARRFRVCSASLKLLPGRRRVRLGFEGPQGAVGVEIPKVAFWRLTALFHERSIAADGPKQPGRRTRGKRS